MSLNARQVCYILLVYARKFLSRYHRPTIKTSTTRIDTPCESEWVRCSSTWQARATPGLMRRQSFEDEREDDSPCASVSQSRVVFTYDSFRRSFLRSYVPSFVPSFLCRLFSLQVSVYVMSNWICAEHKEGGREGREHSIGLFSGE